MTEEFFDMMGMAWKREWERTNPAEYCICHIHRIYLRHLFVPCGGKYKQKYYDSNS